MVLVRVNNSEFTWEGTLDRLKERLALKYGIEWDGNSWGDEIIDVVANDKEEEPILESYEHVSASSTLESFLKNKKKLRAKRNNSVQNVAQSSVMKEFIEF